MHTEICTRVLLVEDNSSDAFFVEELLSQIPDEHFDVCHVECISEAQATFEHGTMPDVVLLDLSLPDSNGMDSIKAIHNAAPHTPISRALRKPGSLGTAHSGAGRRFNANTLLSPILQPSQIRKVLV